MYKYMYSTQNALEWILRNMLSLIVGEGEVAITPHRVRIGDKHDVCNRIRSIA